MTTSNDMPARRSSLVPCASLLAPKPRYHRLAPIVLMLGLALLAGGIPTSADAAPRVQPIAAPAVAAYRLDVELDPAAKTVNGVGRISYANPSGDLLTELYLRLYLRAFRDTNTLWMRESGGSSRGFTIRPGELGDITVSRLTLADGTDLLASSTISDTLMRVPLPRPLAPGQTIDLDLAWESKLPRVFARTGYGGRDDSFFMVGQWYPRLAVYDRGRWDTEPWHANAEFFHDFGVYDVTINVPAGYVVAGVGIPAGPPQERDGRSVVRYTAERVTDFAFAASPDFRIETVRAGDVEIVLYYLPEHTALVRSYLDTAVGSLGAFGRWYGPYPHPRLTIVDVPDTAGGAGGMEYPTLITGGSGGLPANAGFVAYVAAHEIGHQWWPMQTATNEAAEPWLDEGLTEYSGSRYSLEVGDRIGIAPFTLSALAFEHLNNAAITAGLPIDLPAWKYAGIEYGVVYSKTALGLWTLERTVGVEPFRRAMADYLAEYRFKHPTAADFRGSIERSLGPLPWFFDEYVKGGEIDYAVGRLSDGGDQVTILRKGSVRVPVDVRLTLAGGVVTTYLWDGQNQETSYTSPGGRIVRVEIDPERKLLAERAIANNGLAVDPQIGPAAQLGARLMFLFQCFAQVFGMFG